MLKYSDISYCGSVYKIICIMQDYLSRCLSTKPRQQFSHCVTSQHGRHRAQLEYFFLFTQSTETAHPLHPLPFTISDKSGTRLASGWTEDMLQSMDPTNLELRILSFKVKRSDHHRTTLWVTQPFLLFFECSSMCRT